MVVVAEVVLGVFVDDMPQNIVTRVYNYGLDYVQLHGDESRITCDNLRRTIDPDIRPGLRIIKAIPVADARDIDRWREYDGAVDMLLFDTRSDSVGGLSYSFRIALIKLRSKWMSLMPGWVSNLLLRSMPANWGWWKARTLSTSSGPMPPPSRKGMSPS